MCGIYGWINDASASPQQLDRMGKLIAHRGPDDRGQYFSASGRVALGHNRLSIIDLSDAGHQPMISDDSQVIVVFNGEIYNFKTLREELVSLGHTFRSRCDTEVLLHGYRQWGQGIVHRLYGMYAFSIWDATTHSLLLARDPMGMKPLYYWQSPQGSLYFASELKAFLALESFKPKLNHSAICQYLEFNFIHDLESASLEGVKKLPGGHLMTISPGEPHCIRKFFSPPSLEPCSDGAEAIDARVDRFHNVFSQVVQEHLISDVPVGLLLSGGLDSSLVASVASRYGQLSSLSFGFADSTIDERPFARSVAKYLGTLHDEIVITPSEVSDDLENCAWYFDDLFGDWGLISTRVLYQKCRERGMKVVLVGDGADELFGGYRSYDLTNRLRSRTPLSLQLYRWYSGRRWGKEWLPFHYLLDALRQEVGGDDFSAVRLFETRHQLPHNFNMKVDKACMSASVEARMPFLDVRVASEGYAAPKNLLMRNGTNKYLLRRMAERYNLLPREIIHRPKFGASIASSWMDCSPEFRSYAREKILGAGSVTAQFGLVEPMKKYFDQGRFGSRLPSGLSIYSIVAWRLLLLNAWASRYLSPQVISN